MDDQLPASLPVAAPAISRTGQDGQGRCGCSARDKVPI